MKIQNKSNRLSKNKITTLGTVLSIIGILVFAGIKTRKYPIQIKLIGYWNVEIENCNVSKRDWNWCNNTIEIMDKNECRLPTILDDNSTTKKQWSDATGTWIIISTNPDSVFFNVPKNPLHGKYAIRFFIDEKGWQDMPRLIYKMELKNDSTYLICNKAGFIYKREIRDWEGKN